MQDLNVVPPKATVLSPSLCSTEPTPAQAPGYGNNGKHALTNRDEKGQNTAMFLPYTFNNRINYSYPLVLREQKGFRACVIVFELPSYGKNII